MDHDDVSRQQRPRWQREWSGGGALVETVVPFPHRHEKEKLELTAIIPLTATTTAATTTDGGRNVGGPPAPPNDDGDDDDDDGHHPADGDDDGDADDERRTRRRQSTRLPTTPTPRGKSNKKRTSN